MDEALLEFTASGSARALSRAIEEFTAGQGSLSAMVVPWESDPVTLSMSVTSAEGIGWSIEHTNLGTIRLTDLGDDRTKVAILGHEPTHPGKETLIARFDQFARQIQAKFQQVVS